MFKYLAICTGLTLMSYCVSSTAMAQERLNRVPASESMPTQIQIQRVPVNPRLDRIVVPERDEGETASVQHYHCGNISVCNVLISNCAEWGGTWVETGSPGPQGEPQKGTCTVSN